MHLLMVELETDNSKKKNPKEEVLHWFPEHCVTSATSLVA
jgi:hypothetical protein